MNASNITNAERQALKALHESARSNEFSMASSKDVQITGMSEQAKAGVLLNLTRKGLLDEPDSNGRLTAAGQGLAADPINKAKWDELLALANDGVAAEEPKRKMKPEAIRKTPKMSRTPIKAAKAKAHSNNGNGNGHDRPLEESQKGWIMCQLMSGKTVSEVSAGAKKRYTKVKAETLEGMVVSYKSNIRFFERLFKQFKVMDKGTEIKLAS